MNHETSINIKTSPNGDVTIANNDGSITIRADGTIALSTVAPIELVGESLGKLDSSGPGTSQGVVLELLRRRGKKC